MKRRKEGDTQETASAKAGISERRGRDIEHGKRIDPGSKEHDWRTRCDPFANVWESELVLLLEKNPRLTPITLLEYLQANTRVTIQIAFIVLYKGAYKYGEQCMAKRKK
jgi:hypothetical protein